MQVTHIPVTCDPQLLCEKSSPFAQENRLRIRQVERCSEKQIPTKELIISLTCSRIKFQGNDFTRNVTVSLQLHSGMKIKMSTAA